MEATIGSQWKLCSDVVYPAIDNNGSYCRFSTLGIIIRIYQFYDYIGLLTWRQITGYVPGLITKLDMLLFGVELDG